MSTPTRSQGARVHTQPSNRANAALAKGKSKGADDNRRVVYKPVLENPHRIKWPQTPLNVQNGLLACLTDLLPDVAEYHIARETASRKRKSTSRAARHRAKNGAEGAPKPLDKLPEPSKKRRREEDTKLEAKRAKIDPTVESNRSSDHAAPSRSQQQSTTSDPDPRASSNEYPTRSSVRAEPTLDPSPQPLSTKTDIPVPPILKHCTFGINEVTKRLESQLKPPHLEFADSLPRPKPRLRVVLACRTDVDPPLIIEHLPILVAACNSSLATGSDPSYYVKLVTLPMGGEHLLAETIGLRRIAVMALDIETPGMERLESLLSSVATLQASWLAPPSSTNQQPKDLVPTHVKQLKTTAPKDMKVAREKRKREVAEAKQAAKVGGSGDGRKRRKVVQSSEKAHHG